MAGFAQAAAANATIAAAVFGVPEPLVLPLAAYIGEYLLDPNTFSAATVSAQTGTYSFSCQLHDQIKGAQTDVVRL